MAYIWPLPEGTPVTQPFGSNPNNGYNPSGGHTGTDFGVPIGTPIVAVADGVIDFEGWTSGSPTDNAWWFLSGDMVIVLNAGASAPSFVYGHLSETFVSAGQAVKQGDIIGNTGNTGASTGPHLHFEVLPDGWNFSNGTYGRVDPATYCSGYWNPTTIAPASASSSLAANQRNTSVRTNKRDAPSTTGNILDTFDPGLTLTFNGFVHGESVNGNDIWFVGISGAYIWSGAFDDSSTTGIPDLTPAPAPTPASTSVNANQRVTSAATNQRSAAATSAAIVKTFDADTILDFKGFVHGENVSGNDVWFVGAYSDTYFWSGAFTDASTTALNDLTPAKPIPAPVPQPAPTPVPQPAPIVPTVAPYSFTPDFDFVEYHPADINNLQRASDTPSVVVFPANPEKVVIHQFGTPGVDHNWEYSQSVL